MWSEFNGEYILHFFLLVLVKKFNKLNRFRSDIFDRINYRKNILYLHSKLVLGFRYLFNLIYNLNVILYWLNTNSKLYYSINIENMTDYYKICHCSVTIHRPVETRTFYEATIKSIAKRISGKVSILYMCVCVRMRVQNTVITTDSVLLCSKWSAETRPTV